MKNTFFTLTLIFSPILAAKEIPEVVDFNDHVQAILSENCYHCHGPDSSTREPKSDPLRLDREEFAFLERPDGKPPIIKGKPEESEMIKRITSKDPDEVMPTPESHKAPLGEYEVAVLRKWIEQGANYEEHWAFVRAEKPAVPESDWGNNEIDKFVSVKHQEKGLEPSPREEPARLLRRLTFDLTGLPPTPEEVKAFEQAAASDFDRAMKEAVDKLLQTDAYAEHFGRHWLDAVRYADTHGIHIDNYRSIWPYRDWVIEAFRKNMPFDQFTREQIAGDLLPEPTLEQIVATGYNRCLPTTGEGGAIADEYLALYALDQVDTTSAIWLGLTTGCASCHDHKFDPISQKDFYAMSAFFRNSTMSAMDGNSAEHRPIIFAPRIEDRPRLGELESEIAGLDQGLVDRREAAKAPYEAWLAQQVPNQPVVDFPEADFALPLAVKKGEIVSADPTKNLKFAGKTVKSDTLGEVVNLNDSNTDLGMLTSFQAGDQFSYGATIYLDGRTGGSILSQMDSTKDFRGWDLWLENGQLAAHVIDRWPDLAIKAVTEKPLPEKTWVRIMVTYDGQAEPNQRLAIYLDGKPVGITYTHAGNLTEINPEVPVRLGARHPNDRLSGTVGAHSLQIFNRKLSPLQVETLAGINQIEQILAVVPEERTKEQRATLFHHYLDTVDEPTQRLRGDRAKLIAEKEELRKRGANTLVMEEKEGPAHAYVLDRGDYTSPTDMVYAAIPKIFQENPDDERKLSRLDLADWIVSEKNPLTARVTVNRFWYYFFGRGIVETTEDFGIMGARPTHQELLDYLAMEFVESGWDFKHLARLITQSATYQQSGKTTSANREKDSENLYLWRAPRPRLEAEQIRDMALAASGLLVEKIGGPSVKPYQPDGLWEAVAMNQSNTRYFKQDTGENLYRRSLYTFWKRTAAPPTMEILDAPTRETFCVRREPTNTPLAAFVTMNDPQFIEASRALATRVLHAHPSFDERIDLLSTTFMARAFNAEEKEVVRKVLDDHLKHYQENPELAQKLITVGDSKPDESLDQAELATWTLVASQIFNLDETLTK